MFPIRFTYNIRDGHNQRFLFLLLFSCAVMPLFPLSKSEYTYKTGIVTDKYFFEHISQTIDSCAVKNKNKQWKYYQVDLSKISEYGPCYGEDICEPFSPDSLLAIKIHPTRSLLPSDQYDLVIYNKKIFLVQNKLNTIVYVRSKRRKKVQSFYSLLDYLDYYIIEFEYHSYQLNLLFAGIGDCE